MIIREVHFSLALAGQTFLANSFFRHGRRAGSVGIYMFSIFKHGGLVQSVSIGYLIFDILLCVVPSMI